VVGSVAQDEVVRLRQRLREGGHLDAEGRQQRLGGGGANTALPLRHAGHDVVLVAPVGEDAVGDWLLAALSEAGVDPVALARVPGESTRSLVLVDPEGERTVVNLHRCRESGPPERVRALTADALYVRSRELDLADVLAAQLPRALVVAQVPPLARGARPAHVLVGSESDLSPEALADPWAAGRAVAGETLRWVVITRGASGAQAFRPGERLDAPAPRVDAVDSTAAGDVFAAGLLHALVQGRPMAEALRCAVAWGAATVACPGLPGAEAIRRLS